MTPQEKAKDIISFVFNEQHTDDRSKMICLSTPKIALFIVAEIEKALISYDEDYGGGNVDYEFRFWDEVKKELNKL